MAKGRPQGSPNVKDQTVSKPSRCIRPGCGCTERVVLQTTTQEYAGLDGDGRPYTHIIRRRVRCTACGQVRIDRELAALAQQESRR